MPPRRRGAHVVLLGPDGVGKTAVLDALEADLVAAGVPVRRRHLRPHLDAVWRTPPAPEAPVRPASVRGPLGSHLQALAWLVEAHVAHRVRDAGWLRRGGWILQDRDLADLAVDPSRYRSSAPERRVLRLLRCAPRPDVRYVLVASPATLDARRAGRPGGADAGRYRALAGRLPDARVVEAEAALPVVVAAVREDLARRGWGAAFGAALGAALEGTPGAAPGVRRPPASPAPPRRSR